MSTFRVKNEKKIIYDDRITLDAKHKEIIKNFKSKQKELLILEKELEKINNTISNSNKKSEMSDEELDNFLKIINQKKIIIDQIDKYNSNYDLNNYFLNTGHILYKYYDNMKKMSDNTNENIDIDNVLKYDNKNILKYLNPKNNNNINNNINNNNINNNNNNINNNNNKSLSEDILNEENEDWQDEEEELDDININSEDIKSIGDYFDPNKSFKKSDILNDYLQIVDSNYIKRVDDIYIDVNICQKCNIEKILKSTEGYMVCPKCGKIDQLVIDSNKPSFKDPPPEVTYFAYKRINHFNEILTQFQGKETTEIPPEVFDKILIEIKKERILNMAKLTPAKIKNYLRKLRYNKYYEHSVHILNRLNGLPPPILSPILEEKLRYMFKEIQAPFQEVYPKVNKQRKNFLSYYYVLHKFVELLGLDEFKYCFPLLKNREKLYEQDCIWSGICNILGWEFRRSI